jgi:hypothetical protein
MKPFHPVFTVQASRFSTTSANSLKVIRPILKKIHPDLFYKFSSAHIPETNKVCIQNLQEIWNKVFLYQKYLPFDLLTEEIDGDNSFNNNTIENEIAKRTNTEVTIGLNQLLKKNYDLSFYPHPTTEGKDDSPKMVKFPVEIPQELTVLQSPGRPKRFDYISFLKAMFSVFGQQQKLFENFGINFPYTKQMLYINSYLKRTDPSQSQIGRNSTAVQQELSTDLKMQIFETFNTQQLYFKKTIAFAKELEYQRGLLLENSNLNKREGHVKHKPVNSKYGSNTLVNEVNYFLLKGHLRFEGIPADFHIPLILSVKDFLEVYARILSFSYAAYSCVFLIIYYNENMEKKSRKDLSLYTILDSSDALQREKVASSVRGRYVLKIPHDYKESTLLNFLQKTLPFTTRLKC